MMGQTACMFAAADERDRKSAIAAGKAILGREVVIPSDADFTPAGKRTAQVVKHAINGRKSQRMIRWYVAGRAFRTLNLCAENVALTSEWKGAEAKS
ncbi:hypothetical protein HX798_23065 [Pseudomonas putida]|uniref:Uncharacterized protein n=1 Tax=Pseudomonas putida TaxID=303 RepID=A0A7Y7ZDV5_PSEPU|nr:hypothetical protein [Pseudomonas putida]NWC83146.1 hypothetical protein [Pseudomonas putida]